MSLFRSERVVNATLENPVVVGGVKQGPVAIAADGAVNPHVSAVYAITKSASAAALTIADPTVGADDGVTITFTAASSTVRAHVVTSTGSGFADGATAIADQDDTATFAAFNGAGFTIMAYQGIWQVMYEVGITFSDA